jgi:hypothetical protein
MEQNQGLRIAFADNLGILSTPAITIGSKTGVLPEAGWFLDAPKLFN